MDALPITTATTGRSYYIDEDTGLIHIHTWRTREIHSSWWENEINERIVTEECAEEALTNYGELIQFVDHPLKLIARLRLRYKQAINHAVAMGYPWFHPPDKAA